MNKDNSQRVEINRRNSPQIKRSFTLLNAVTDGNYGPAVNVGHGFAFAIFVKRAGATGTNRLIIEARDENNNWATWKDISVPTGTGTELVEAISAVSAVRAKMSPYGGGTFTVSVEVLNVKAIEAGAVPGTIDWSNLTNKPATFTPAAHTHAGSEVSAATASAQGAVELATDDETFSAIDPTRAVTPASWGAADGQTRNSLAPRGGVMCDGTASAGFFLALTGNPITTGPFGVSMVIKPPTVLPSGNDAFWVLGPNASGGGAVQTVYCRGESGGQLRILIFGASGANFNRWTYAGFYAKYSSSPVMVTFVRNATGNPSIYFNQVDVTSQGTFDESGGPGWQGTLSGDYLTGLHSGSASSVATVHALSIFNYAPSASKVARIYRNGGQPPEEDKWGRQADVASGSIAKLKLYLVVGGTSVTYNAVAYAAGTTFVGVSGVTTYTETAGTEAVYEVGALAYLALDDGIGFQLHDQSTNKLDAVMTSTGMSHLIPKRNGYIRTPGAGLTWTSTHESKSVLGVAQQAIPSGAVTTLATLAMSAATSGAGATVGTTNSATRVAAATTYAGALKKVLTLANQMPAGTAANDLDRNIDPDSANWTGTAQYEEHYTLTEGTP